MLDWNSLSKLEVAHVLMKRIFYFSFFKRTIQYLQLQQYITDQKRWF